MRINIPKEIQDELNAMKPYVEYIEGKGVELKKDAPTDVRERYYQIGEMFAKTKNLLRG